MPRTRPPAFPELELQILMRGIKKKDIAAQLGITAKALSYKLTGRTEFMLSEVRQIAELFPQMPWEKLFRQEKKCPDCSRQPELEVSVQIDPPLASLLSRR